jgi:hypothetical protein
MRYLLVFLLALGIAGLANAHPSHWSSIEPDKDSYVGDGAFDGREGGEDFGDALPIESIPYTDTGATCDNVDDIAGSCYYDGGAPDVVYSYSPASNEVVTVSLCGSEYDTGLAVFDSGYNEVACNDDYCGLQSELTMGMTAGETYYIVVDGYGSACGSYILNVFVPEVCDPTCPDGALEEGEPTCYDGYYDEYNGGCNSVGWTEICPQEDGMALMCGEGGNYIYEGSNYRDTDWYSCYGDGGTMTATVCAEFPVQLIFIYGTNCNNLIYDLATAPAFEEVSLSRTVAEGVEVWIWVGTQSFSGVPCGSIYLLTMEGIWCEPTAVEDHSWGSIKSLYR